MTKKQKKVLYRIIVSAILLIAVRFVPVEGQTNQWSLTVNRAAFAEDSVCTILLQHSGGKAIETGLTVTGRETEDQVILTLDYIPRKLSVSSTDSDSVSALDSALGVVSAGLVSSSPLPQDARSEPAIRRQSSRHTVFFIRFLLPRTKMI